MLKVESHPLLDLRAFETIFPASLGEMPSPREVIDLLALDQPAPLASSDRIREEVRRLLRTGGFKPTGRNKPASEYLLKAVREGLLRSINLAVDVCNCVSLHSGLPISVIDSERATDPLSVGTAREGMSYVFNASGQILEAGGLLCLFDAEGPCANGVKDSERTKTRKETRRTLSLIWGTTSLPDHAQQTESWYRALLEAGGAKTQGVFPDPEFE